MIKTPQLLSFLPKRVIPYIFYSAPNGTAWPSKKLMLEGREPNYSDTGQLQNLGPYHS